MKAVKFDKTGKKGTAGKDVSDSIFAVEVSQPLLAQYVYVYLSNQRTAQAKSKDRSEVRGGGKKPWRQKGTGRARHGSSRSPIWTKGGVTFGPTGQQNYKKRLNKKVKTSALKMALSAKAGSNLLAVWSELTGDSLKTKEVANSLDKIITGIEAKKALLITAGENSLLLGARNMPNVKVKSVADLNAYDVMSSRSVVLTETALTQIEEKWGK